MKAMVPLVIALHEFFFSWGEGGVKAEIEEQKKYKT